jgi:Na+/H+ antiporter NhaD/arsenite permease-like protein
MMTVGLVLSLPRLSMGRHIGPSELAAVGVLVLLTTGVVSPADLVGSFHVLWRPFVAVLSIMLTINEVAGVGFNESAARMIPISVAGWLTAYAVLRVIFRRQLDSTEEGKIASLQPARLSRPAKQFIGLMVVALGCYPVLSDAGGPVWAVAAAGATVQLAASLSWQIMIFLFCVFVIVRGLRNVGLVDRITELYSSAIGPAAKVAVIGISSAIGSAVPVANSI